MINPLTISPVFNRLKDKKYFQKVKKRFFNGNLIRLRKLDKSTYYNVVSIHSRPFVLLILKMFSYTQITNRQIFSLRTDFF